MIRKKLFLAFIKTITLFTSDDRNKILNLFAFSFIFLSKSSANLGIEQTEVVSWWVVLAHNNNVFILARESTTNSFGIPPHYLSKMTSLFVKHTEIIVVIKIDLIIIPSIKKKTVLKTCNTVPCNNIVTT